MTIRTITIPVKDLPAATAVYRTLLGTEPYVDQPFYVGFRPADGPELGLDPNGDVALGPITYYQVSDIEAATAALTAQGATTERKTQDVGGGNLRAILRDTDGNPLGLFQPAA